MKKGRICLIASTPSINFRHKIEKEKFEMLKKGGGLGSKVLKGDIQNFNFKFSPDKLSIFRPILYKSASTLF